MAGRVKWMIDRIIDERSKGNQAVARMTRAKMVLKGIYPDNYSSTSGDDPILIEKLSSLANEMNIKL